MILTISASPKSKIFINHSMITRSGNEAAEIIKGQKMKKKIYYLWGNKKKGLSIDCTLRQKCINQTQVQNLHRRKCKMYSGKQTDTKFHLHFCCIHCIMSFRITPLYPSLLYFKLNVSGPLVHRCLFWVMVPTGLGDRISILKVEKGLGHILVIEENRCRSDSWFLAVWLPVAFGFEDFIPWLVMFMLGLEPCGGFSGGGPRIWAEGFIRSRHRRIRLPILRPTCMSLSCIFRWTLSATSNTARVRL